MHNTVYLERLKGANGIIQKDTDKSNGMPTSCQDLYILGHQLNGFYLIKGINATSNNHVEMVDCLFTNPCGIKQDNNKYILKYKLTKSTSLIAGRKPVRLIPIR